MNLICAIDLNRRRPRWLGSSRRLGNEVLMHETVAMKGFTCPEASPGTPRPCGVQELLELSPAPSAFIRYYILGMTRIYLERKVLRSRD